MNKFYLFTTLCIFFYGLLNGQVSHTANDMIVPYDGTFRAGSNFGLYPGFTDEQLADLAAGRPELGLKGVGVKTLRPGLFEQFTYDFGYDIRIPTFQHYQDIGLEDMTVIMGFPTQAHRDQSQYCPGLQSELFANLYEPIWDNGENGTPVNENNYYAAYIYNVATRYKDYVKFYEIWNEPGFDYTGAEGWLLPGQAGNWWDADPSPCSYKLRAPIEHYIRTMRISWEVVKSVDPSAYIVISGLGYPSFLDAILRNTDNPNGGTPTADYPLGGGAYFDVMGLHSYPHFDGSLREWNNDIGGFEYFRHSDAAAEGIMSRQAMFQDVLSQYGYDDSIYPKKLSTITECNIPRVPVGDYIGSSEAQRNFIIKAVITCIKNAINQLHVFKIAELGNSNSMDSEFEVMGLYQQLNPNNGNFQSVNEQGIALRTATDMLFGKEYDAAKSAEMQLGDGVKGGAFNDSNDNYTYVLWAETRTDRSESAAANYSFPTGMGIANLMKKDWDYGYSLQESEVTSQNIALTGTPIFLTEKIFAIDLDAPCVPAMVNFMDETGGQGAAWEWTFEGGEPATSNSPNPTVIYNNPGQFNTRLIVRDVNGNVIANQSSMIEIKDVPQASFTTNILGTLVQFDDAVSPFAEDFFWDFGDGFTSTEANPEHVYAFGGNFTISLTVSNECGATTITMPVGIMNTTTSTLDYTANDTVPEYNKFLPGVNLNYYPPWTDEQLADLAAGNPSLQVPGIGAKVLRTQLPQEFFSFWDYDIRLDAFQHYQGLDMSDNAVTLGFPEEILRDDTEYCPGNRSALFKNLYLDVWDDGVDGTPINEQNYYAKYVYETVIRYKDYVRFWEIWKSPDFDFTGERAWREPGEFGNWWDNDPSPCEYVLGAPIYHYVRMLRISYEIIKTLDPDAFVSLSGMAHPSFLDAILRNSDNPLDGSITPDYPLGGGAYFDAFGFVGLPHLDGSTRYWNQEITSFSYERHSDAAVEGIANLKNRFQQVFENYGYGVNFPEKIWNISRINIPRKARLDYIGGDDVQRNYLMKAYVEAARNEIRQFQVYEIGEEANEFEATSEFQQMGLYQKLSGVSPYNQSPTLEGIGYKTSSDLLFENIYDAQRTSDLQLPIGVRGAAFRQADNTYIYVLWAETSQDFSEAAFATYTFPNNLNIENVEKRQWDFSQTNVVESINPNGVFLNATPIFLTEIVSTASQPIASFSANPRSICPDDVVNFTDLSQHAETWLWTFEGGNPSTSMEQFPSVTFTESGNYEVSLTVSNEVGSNTNTMSAFVNVLTLPTADFTFVTQGSTVNFTNNSLNADSYFWDFGDDEVSTEANPLHVFTADGLYEVQLIVQNGTCEPDTFTQSIMIELDGVTASFSADNNSGCPDLTVEFSDLSNNATAWEWTFEGGEPMSSTEQSPTVLYEMTGNYPVRLIASNEEDMDTIFIENFVQVDSAAAADFEYEVILMQAVVFNNLSINADSYLWDFGDGETSTTKHPFHEFIAGETYQVSLTVFNSHCPPSTIVQTLSFAPPPVPMFETDVEEGCPGLEVQFTDLSENATEWMWQFPGGTPETSIEQNPVITYDQPGIWSVTLGVSNASGSNAISFFNVVEIDTGAVADFTLQQNGAVINLTNESEYALNYEWDFGDGTTSIASHPTHTYTDNGEFVVQLAAFNFTCGWDTITQVVTILEAPIADFTFQESEDCDDNTIEYMDMSQYTPTAWLWTFEGGDPATSTDPNPAVFYGESGTYEATLVVSNEAGVDSIKQLITINTHLFLEENYEICKGDSLHLYGTTFNSENLSATVLLEGDGVENCDTTITIEVELLPTFVTFSVDTIFEGDTLVFGDIIITESATYNYTFTAENGCDSTHYVRVYVFPSPRPFDLTTDKIFTPLEISPNPFNEQVRFDFYTEKRNSVRLEIFDLYGRLVRVLVTEETLEAGQHRAVWSDMEAISGVYWCRLRVGDRTTWRKVVRVE